ncbi:MAG: hypothetical protein O3B13_04435 [Planctomycetota bacterium]|nr:hypothetical protein [Planctomycetota bacterium]
MSERTAVCYESFGHQSPEVKGNQSVLYEKCHSIQQVKQLSGVNRTLYQTF